MKVFQFIACLFALLACRSTAFAQRNLKDIPSPDPEVERKSFVVADGFEVNLFAADPKIAKPIQMNFDPQGRLWIVSSEVYPHIKPGQKPTDKVLVLEDTNNDGRSDKTTVFADGLLIPTGIEPGDGGAYVANSTELLHLRDTDNDGKADEKSIVLSGFGTEDTHHILHTLRWGPDGMLYFNQSIYIHSHIETPYGVRRLNAGGIWQFRPETLQLEVFARGWVNSWGHHFNDWGVSFVTDGAGGEGINYAVPGASYVTAFGASRILHGLNPGSPKYCGLEVVGGRHLPDDWQGNLLTNDFRGHRVCRFKLEESGSGFIARQQVELIKSSHVAFRPIDIKLGPDGAIYIADWYNPIIQHGEVDFRDPRRDHVHGRIWRVTAKGRPLVSRPKFSVDARVWQLLEHLRSKNSWTRHNAKRVVKERFTAGEKADRKDRATGRGKSRIQNRQGAWSDVIASHINDAVDILTSDKRKKERTQEFEHYALELLWLNQSLDLEFASSRELLERLLESKNHNVRAAATRVLQHWKDRLPNTLDLLAQLVTDEHPRVRLEAVRVLGSIPTAQSAVIAMRALDYPVDQFLDYALWLTARERQDDWLPLVEAGKLSFDENVAHLAFALKAVGTTKVAPLLVKLLQQTEDGSQHEAEIIEAVASLGGPNELRLVFNAALDANTKASRSATLLNVLAERTRKRKLKPSGDLKILKQLLSSENAGLKAAAARCVGLWKVEPARSELLAIAGDQKLNESLRKAAINGLAGLGGVESKKLINVIASSDERFAIRSAAAVSMARLDLKTGADLTVNVLKESSTSDDVSELIGTFIERKQGPSVLKASLNGQKLPGDIAKLTIRAIKSSGRNFPELVDALNKAGGITGKPKKLTPQEMQQLVADVSKNGDPNRGEIIYRRLGLDCMKCHAIGGAGGRVGPDLVSIGSTAQIDYLLESLLEPTKKVKENYHSIVVVTGEGKILSGIKVRQTDSELILRNADDREISISLDNIEEQSPGASLMPSGLTEKLTKNELVDLTRFLSALGKETGFTVSKRQLVRRWQTLQATKEALFRLRRTRYGSVTSDDPAYLWAPVYSTVAGVLPVSELPNMQVRNRAGSVAFVRFQLDVTTAGKVGVKLNSTQGISMWLGTKPVTLSETTQLDFAKGTHRITLAIDRANRQEDLSVELVEVAGSSARAQVRSGK